MAPEEIWDLGGSVMKRIVVLLSTIAVVVLASTAVRAADLARPYAPPPPPLPVYSWTGFYAGINGGFGGDRNQYPFSIGGIAGTSSLNSSGFFGGGQVGYNWQFSPNWLVGIEADLNDADINGAANASTGGAAASGNLLGQTICWSRGGEAAPGSMDVMPSSWCRA